MSGVSGSTVFQPILTGRAVADRHNAYEINAITGVKPYFTDVLPQAKGNLHGTAQAALGSYPFMDSTFPGQSLPVTSGQSPPSLTPDLRVPVVFVLVPFRELPPIQVAQSPYKPRNIVRHLNMPQMSPQETKDLGRPPLAMPVETMAVTEQSGSSSKADDKKKKTKGKK